MNAAKPNQHLKQDLDSRWNHPGFAGTGTLPAEGAARLAGAARSGPRGSLSCQPHDHVRVIDVSAEFAGCEP